MSSFWHPSDLAFKAPRKRSNNSFKPTQLRGISCVLTLR